MFRSVLVKSRQYLVMGSYLLLAVSGSHGQSPDAVDDVTHGQQALRLMRSGDRMAAAAAWDRIEDSETRYRLAQEMAGELQPERSAAGGGALADFDTLINLITTTVEPETWDVNGGVGAINSFPTGVYVDAEGCLQRTSISARDRLVASASRAAASASPVDMAALRKISLPRLERAVARCLLSGKTLPDDMLRLAGLQRVQYVLINSTTQDLILAGPACDAGPSLSLDAWMAVSHNAGSGSGRFGCSINPRRENLAAAQQFINSSSGRAIPRGRRRLWAERIRDHLGRQEVTIHGVDPRSHAARIIVAADYHMKLIGIGLEPGIPKIPSYLSLLELGPNGQPPPLDLLRWWFTLQYDHIAINQERTCFELVGDAARVQCENEFLAEQGERVHTGQSDIKNQEFAAKFTRHLSDLAERHRIYRQLQGLFDLAMAAAIIQEEDLASQVAWRDHWLSAHPVPLSLGAPVTTDVESVVQIRELNRHVFVTGVSGGVECNPGQEVSRLPRRSLDYEPESLRPAGGYQQDGRWWWD